MVWLVDFHFPPPPAAAAATKNDGRLRKMLVFHLRKISHHFLALKTVRRAHGKGGMAA